jgi:Na+/melibiose symporter-like transporter
MRELTSARWILAKGGLFLVLGVMAVGLLLVERPTVRTAVLIAAAVWAFCRFYYFAFYVMERYVDPGYRFSGLISLARYFVRRGADVGG